MTVRAIVRPPGKTYVRALTGRRPPPAVDLALALEQHAGYVAALRKCGVEVTALSTDDAHPDSVFVQDRVLVLDGLAIVCPSAVESGRGEEEALLRALDPALSLHRLLAPPYLDGGDVLIAEDTIYVGLSGRSNEAAVHELAALFDAAPLGRRSGSSFGPPAASKRLWLPRTRAPPGGRFGAKAAVRQAFRDPRRSGRRAVRVQHPRPRPRCRRSRRLSEDGFADRRARLPGPSRRCRRVRPHRSGTGARRRRGPG